MDRDDSSKIAVYVVWSPQVGAQEKHVDEASELVPDERTVHYWDENMVIGSQFQTLFHPNGDELILTSPAWDVWLLFDPQARWDEGEAPSPAWWEHQLRGMPEDVRLDPERFAAKAEEILGKR